MSIVDVAAVVREAIETGAAGSLRLYGEWFGGRPWDNYHGLVSVADHADRLVVGFDAGEVLTVWSPGRASFDQGGLRIQDASRLTWEWSYDPDRTVYKLEYVVAGDSVEVSDTLLGEQRRIAAGEPAIWLLTVPPFDIGP